MIDDGSPESNARAVKPCRRVVESWLGVREPLDGSVYRPLVPGDWVMAKRSDSGFDDPWDGPWVFSGWYAGCRFRHATQEELDASGVTGPSPPRAAIRELVDAIRGAIRIEPLWGSSGGDEDEMRALSEMRASFQRLIEKYGDEVSQSD
jgi:hypothetical protein